MIDHQIAILDAFKQADQVLMQGVSGITDLITTPGLINLDFADVKAVMSNAGSALMGIGSARGEDRARAAAEMAVSSPLLEASIDGAHGVLLSIAGGSDLGLFEVSAAANLIQSAAHEDANIIFGTVIDDALGDEVRVTVIAAGFEGGQPPRRQPGISRSADLRSQRARPAPTGRRRRLYASRCHQRRGTGRGRARRPHRRPAPLRRGARCPTAARRPSARRRRRPRRTGLPEVARARIARGSRVGRGRRARCVRTPCVAERMLGRPRSMRPGPTVPQRQAACAMGAAQMSEGDQMAERLKRAAAWLGLVTDDRYGEYDDARSTTSRPKASAARSWSGPSPTAGLEHSGDRHPAGDASGPAATRHAPRATARLDPRTADMSRIITVHPRTYNEARTIGEHFRDGVPVIMNLSEMEDVDAKRLVDFAAGLIFGLRGTIERVTSKVFLLSPHNVNVTAEDKERIAGGFFNQS